VTRVSGDLPVVGERLELVWSDDLDELGPVVVLERESGEVIAARVTARADR